MLWNYASQCLRATSPGALRRSGCPGSVLRENKAGRKPVRAANGRVKVIHRVKVSELAFDLLNMNWHRQFLLCHRGAFTGSIDIWKYLLLDLPTFHTPLVTFYSFFFKKKGRATELAAYWTNRSFFPAELEEGRHFCPEAQRQGFNLQMYLYASCSFDHMAGYIDVNEHPTFSLSNHFTNKIWLKLQHRRRL